MHQPIPESDKVKDRHNLEWNDWSDGHDSGYVIKKDGHGEKNFAKFDHAIKEEAEQHALKSASGIGKHASAAVEKGASKHLDQASVHGKGSILRSIRNFTIEKKTPRRKSFNDVISI